MADEAGAFLPQDVKALSIGDLAKFGHFEELRRRARKVDERELVHIFGRAVTDFRTVKRKPGHQKILLWCIERGLDFRARAGCLNEPVVCLAAASGNKEIVETMVQKGLPECPFARTSAGDVEFLKGYAAGHELADLKDENGFNPLFYCAQSGLGRRDEGMKGRMAECCRFLLDCGVSPRHEVQFELPVFPAFLCASSGGNEQVMRLLLDHGGLTPKRFHQMLEHALEPHQRSGEPFYAIAELILRQGFDINQVSPDEGRALLHGSASRGTVKAVRWLLEHGANPNVRDAEGRTPLHVAAERNTATSVVKLLVEAGAEVRTKDVSGRTAIEYACENGRPKVVEYLASVEAE